MCMKITIISLFPDMFEGFLQESIVKKAQEKGALELEIVNLRDFAVDEHNTVDDRPYGGGAGMVLMAEPVDKALQKYGEGAYTLMTSPRGFTFNQEKARSLSKKDHIVIFAGHYEAVDERAVEMFDEEISIGDYVLTGGELPAAVITDAVARLLPGVLKKEDATEIESFFEVSVEELMDIVDDNDELKKLHEKGVKTLKLLEYPHYTRPQEYKGKKVPDVLLSGHHKEIKKWQLKKSYEITKKLKDS